jgi:hypothetical protein
MEHAKVEECGRAGHPAGGNCIILWDPVQDSQPTIKVCTLTLGAHYQASLDKHRSVGGVEPKLKTAAQIKATSRPKVD